MASQSWGQLIASVPTAGTLYNTYTTAKSLLTSATATSASAGFVTLPPGFFQPGAVLDFDILLAVSWASGNTMTFQINIGPTANIVAWTSGAMKVTTSGGTTEPLNLRIALTCQAIGNGTQTKLMPTQQTAMGRMICAPGATAAANYAAAMGFAPLQEATPALGTGFDSTVANQLDFLCAMGTSNGSNGVQLMGYKVVSYGNTAF